jgi:hypothetical protein
MPTCLQGLIIALSNFIIINPSEMFRILYNEALEDSKHTYILMKAVLDKWLLYQHLFRGDYAIGITTIGLF